MRRKNNCISGDKKTARSIVKGFWYVGEDDMSCMREPAPITKESVQRCGIPKCGREEFENFVEVRKKDDPKLRSDFVARKGVSSAFGNVGPAQDAVYRLFDEEE